MRITQVAFAVTLIAATGCGSDDDSSPSTAKPPKELFGSYATQLHRSDLPPNPPPELTGGTRWKLTIARSGGVGGRLAFTIADPRRGTLESSSFTATGDRIRLKREECAAGGTEHFYDNEYRYELAGKRLMLAKVTNRCPDQVALTILTSRPWTKGG